MGVPQDTILYLAGWCWKYDGHYPEYWSAPELGGAEKFRALVNLARDSGYHVMPTVTNASTLGQEYNYPLFR